MSNGETPEATSTVTSSVETSNTESSTQETPSTPAPSGSVPKTAPLPQPSRASGPLAARGLGVAKPVSPTVSTEELEKAEAKQSKPKPQHPSGGKRPPKKTDERTDKPAAAPKQQKVAVPNLRHGLDADLEAELEAELAAADVDAIFSTNAGMADRKESLAEGDRVPAQVLKIHQDSVYVSLGGPDEGAVPFEQFEQEPTVGESIEVIVRAFSNEDGLYVLGLPGAAVEASDWEDIDEGSVVDALVTGSNTGGLEVKVGNMKGFIPISQIADYRVEDTSEFIDQKFLCVVTESNERRGNLVLSRRAVLEREKEAKKKERLEEINEGDLCEGVVRSIKDFGAFVDVGGLDGLIHISKLAWERVKHPSEVLEVGQKVKVKIEKVDKETGKMSLSYRDLLENPWDTAEADYPVGSIHQGTVTRTAPFGAFVKIGPAVEGLCHISELANHRVSKVEAFLNEGDEVEVKVLSMDRDSQKVALSIKQANPIAAEPGKPSEHPADEPPRDVAIKAQHSGPLKGGNNRESGGERFGLRW